MKTSNRAHLRLTLPLLLLALCLTLNGCFFLIPTPAEPNPVDPADLGSPMTFEKAGITLHLTDKFKEEQSERGFDAYYTTDYCGVVVLKEPFTLEAGLADRPLEQYIKNVIENNGHTNIEPQTGCGTTSTTTTAATVASTPTPTRAPTPSMWCSTSSTPWTRRP